MIRQHRGKITAGVAGAAVIVGLILSTPSNTNLTPEAAADSALAHAVELAEDFEGLRLTPYHDVAGFATVGYGHLLSLEPNADLTQFQAITEAQADSLLAVDMGVAFECVETYVTVSLTWNESAALADFVFNEGCGRLQHSTLLRELNAGNKAAVPGQLRRWEYAGGHIEEGLERRREAEVKLWHNR